MVLVNKIHTVHVYLRTQLRVLPAFTLSQTFGSTSVHSLTPETFAVIIPAKTVHAFDTTANTPDRGYTSLHASV